MTSLFSDNRLTMVVGAVVAVTAAIYVAFGPTTEVAHMNRKSGKRRRKSDSESGPRGLHNSGNTCFVNAVLQAASACPALLMWLEELSLQNADKTETLRGSFNTVLRVINGHESEEDTEPGEPEVWAPARLFRTLRTFGWVVNSGEQDAHEFFQALFSTIEEELDGSKASAAVSLLDADAVSESVNSEVSEDNGGGGEEESRGRNRRRRRTRSRSASGVVVRSGEELSLSSIKGQTLISCSNSTPFTGTLTNRVSFKQSGKSKSPTSSTAFNNITLSLPVQTLSGNAPVTLETLLHMFVSTESVQATPENGDLVKQLTFARLPECLCFHIQRTAFANGASFKRNDGVLFPTILNMDSYAYNRQIYKQKAMDSVAATPATDTESQASCLWSPDDGSIPSISADPGYFTNNYTLRAVVVHLGGIDSGHYVTYRREPESPLKPSGGRKWYYTSDALVKEVSIEEVLKTNPYMLFYEKIHAIIDNESL